MRTGSLAALITGGLRFETSATLLNPLVLDREVPVEWNPHLESDA